MSDVIFSRYISSLQKFKTIYLNTRFIHDWGTKKWTKIFVGLIFANNIYLKQI